MRHHGGVLAVLLALAGFAAADEIPPLQIVTYCTISNMDRKPLLTLPGRSCLFEENGSFFSADEGTLTHFGPKRRRLWKVALANHHELHRTQNGDLLVLSSEVRRYLGQDTRFDVLNVVSPEGKVKKHFAIFEHVDELLRHRPHGATSAVFRATPLNAAKFKAPFEFGNVNSFYEIPPNPLADRNPAFRAGGFLVNVAVLGRIFIVDSALEKVLWTLDNATRGYGDVHDVQMLANGHMLLLVNAYQDPLSGKRQETSGAEEFDPLTGQLAWKYAPTDLHIPARGGIQALEPGPYVLSFGIPGATEVRLVNAAGKILARKTAPARAQLPEAAVGDLEAARVLDLGAFLKANGVRSNQ